MWVFRRDTGVGAVSHSLVCPRCLCAFWDILLQFLLQFGRSVQNSCAKRGSGSALFCCSFLFPLNAADENSTVVSSKRKIIHPLNFIFSKNIGKIVRTWDEFGPNAASNPNCRSCCLLARRMFFSYFSGSTSSNLWTGIWSLICFQTDIMPTIACDRRKQAHYSD